MPKPNPKKFVEQPENIADAFTPLGKASKKRLLKAKLDSIRLKLKANEGGDDA